MVVHITLWCLTYKTPLNNITKLLTHISQTQSRICIYILCQFPCILDLSPTLRSSYCSREVWATAYVYVYSTLPHAPLRKYIGFNTLHVPSPGVPLIGPGGCCSIFSRMIYKHIIGNSSLEKVFACVCHLTSLMRSKHNSDNGSLPLGNRPLPEPMWTKIYVDIWRRFTTISYIGSIVAFVYKQGNRPRVLHHNDPHSIDILHIVQKTIHIRVVECRFYHGQYDLWC